MLGGVYALGFLGSLGLPGPMVEGFRVHGLRDYPRSPLELLCLLNQML